MYKCNSHISFLLASSLLVLVNINAFHYLWIEHQSPEIAFQTSFNPIEQTHSCDDFILNHLHFISPNVAFQLQKLEHFIFYKHKSLDFVFISKYTANNLGRDPPKKMAST